MATLVYEGMYIAEMMLDIQKRSKLIGLVLAQFYFENNLLFPQLCLLRFFSQFYSVCYQHTAPRKMIY